MPSFRKPPHHALNLRKQSVLRRRSRQYLKFISLGCCAAAIGLFLNLFFLASSPVSAKIPNTIAPAIFFKQTSVSDQSDQLVQLGTTHYQAGQFADAIAAWQQAVQHFASQNDRANQAAVLSNLAMAHQQLGQWQEANQAIADSLDLLENGKSAQNLIKTQSLLGQVLNIQGNLQLAQGQPQQALKTWQKTADLFQQASDRSGMTRSLINQTQALRALGFYQRAKTTLEQVAQTLQDQPDSQLKASSLLNLGDALRLMGAVRQSQTALQQSLAIAQALKSPSDITLALLSLGNTLRTEKPIEALNYYQQALETAPSATRVQIQLNQLRLLIDTHQRPKAQSLIHQIESQLNQLPPSRMTIYATVNLAQSITRLTTSEKVDDTEEETEENTQKIDPEINQQENQIATKNAVKLLAIAAQQAQKMSDQPAESYALGYLGELYEKNQQWSEARSLTEKALVLAQMSNAADITYRWQWQLGRLLNAQGQTQAAIATYTETIKTLSSIRQDLVASNLDMQFSFRESVEPVYRQFVGLLLQPSVTSQENLRKAREVIESLQLAELDNFFRESCLSDRPTQIDYIDSTAAVIYPIVLKDRLEVVLSIANRPLRHYATNLSQPDLDSLSDQMRYSLRRTSLEKERLAIAQKIYNLLIRPAESDLTNAGIKTLVFVPDGSLKNIPMAALHDGQQYLIEKYGISIAPGLQLLDPRPLAPSQLQVLVGGLSESRHGFISLPGVETEISQIKSEIPAQVLLNQKFTSASLQQLIEKTPFPVVHLATHGQFSSNAEETFVLAWDHPITVKQLGELLQRRAQETQHPIELLVLSACETADGDRRAALGLAGVAVRSGARSTVASLWAVDDQATSAFMTEFYQALAQPNMTKAEALRHAQQIILKQPGLRHPYYWAPFVLVGNWL
ncbi:CHAT domain-containing protein [Phormidesmis sp. 146-35]